MGVFWEQIYAIRRVAERIERTIGPYLTRFRIWFIAEDNHSRHIRKKRCSGDFDMKKLSVLESRQHLRYTERAHIPISGVRARNLHMVTL